MSEYIRNQYEEDCAMMGVNPSEEGLMSYFEAMQESLGVA